MQAFRQRRRPVTAAALAEELGVSLRTVYRDVETLVSLGAPIEGEAGLGYVLGPGFFLPPLNFDEEELDAIILGLRLVAHRDPELEEAADRALAKIAAVLPPERQDEAATSGLLGGPTKGRGGHVAAIRQAMHAEEKLRLDYADKRDHATQRTVWPVAVGFFEAAEVLAAWCELRRDFRHFRLDRIVGLTLTGERYPARRRILLADWRAQMESDLD